MALGVKYIDVTTATLANTPNKITHFCIWNSLPYLSMFLMGFEIISTTTVSESHLRVSQYEEVLELDLTILESDRFF